MCVSWAFYRYGTLNLFCFICVFKIGLCCVGQAGFDQVIISIVHCAQADFEFLKSFYIVGIADNSSVYQM